MTERRSDYVGKLEAEYNRGSLSTNHRTRPDSLDGIRKQASLFRLTIITDQHLVECKILAQEQRLGVQVFRDQDQLHQIESAEILVQTWQKSNMIAYL